MNSIPGQGTRSHRPHGANQKKKNFEKRNLCFLVQLLCHVLTLPGSPWALCPSIGACSYTRPRAFRVFPEHCAAGLTLSCAGQRGREGPLRSLFWLTDAWCKMLNLSEPRVQVWNEECLASMDKCLINVIFLSFVLSPSADCHKVHRTGLPYFRVSREVFSSLQMKNSQ